MINKLAAIFWQNNLNSLVFFVIICTLGSLIFAPLAWLSSAGLVLMIQKTEGLKIFSTAIIGFLACISLIYFYFLVISNLEQFIFNANALLIQFILPALVIGIALKISQSLSLVLIMLIDYAILIALILWPFYDYFLDLILANFAIFSQVSQTMNLGLDQFLANVDQRTLAESVLSVLFSIFFIQCAVIGMIAKVWLNRQNKVDLSFKDELNSLQAFDWMGLVTIALFLMVYWLDTWLILKFVLASFVAYFFIIGLALIYQFFRQRNSNRGLIICTYILIFLLIDVSFIFVSSLAIINCAKNFLFKKSKK